MSYVTKNDLIEIFHDTEEFCNTDDNLKRAVQDSIKGTVFYNATDYPPIPERKFNTTKISIVRRRTLEAAISVQKRHLELKIAVHNFASATNPGGAVIYGSRAQEEGICRCTTLYPVLNTEENFNRFYNVNRQLNDFKHTDACIYTPEIVICKSDTDRPSRLPRDKWDLVDVITIAAPNLRVDRISDDELAKLHESRLRHMFTVVANHGAEIFVTGAFGCGAFKNNPYVVAQVYQKVLAEFDGCFKEIIFAIYCRSHETANLDAFQKVFGVTNE